MAEACENLMAKNLLLRCNRFSSNNQVVDCLWYHRGGHGSAVAATPAGGAGVSLCVVSALRRRTARAQAGVNGGLWPSVEDYLAEQCGEVWQPRKRGVKRDELGDSLPW